MSVVLSAGNVAALLSPGVSGLTYGAVAGMPALLPSLIGGAVGVAATAASFCYIPETNTRR